MRYIDYRERRKREKSHSFNSQKRERVTLLQDWKAIRCAGAFTNRKLGIAALQITDLSTPMHRLSGSCAPQTLQIETERILENMSNETKRKHSIQVRLSDDEYEAFNRKFKASGMKSRSDFFCHMIFTGYIVFVQRYWSFIRQGAFRQLRIWSRKSRNFAMNYLQLTLSFGRPIRKLVSLLMHSER